MATVDSPRTTSHDTDSAIHAVLNRLRWLIRAYVLAEGLAWCVIFAVMAFWFSLAIDWLFELPRGFRTVLLFVSAVVVGYIFFRYVIGRAVTRMSDSSMAVLLERRYDDFKDRLVTSIELEGRDSVKGGYNDGMFQHTRHEAADLVRSAGLAPVFNMIPLVVATVLLTLSVASVVLFGIFQQPSIGTWSNRNLMLGDQVWPRISKIEVAGFEELDEEGYRVHKVAKGGGVMVNVLALVSRPKSEAGSTDEPDSPVQQTKLSIPESIEIRHDSEGGISGVANMTRIADLSDRGQAFHYSFENVQTTTEFDVIAKHDQWFGKADRVENLKIVVVPSPGIKGLKLQPEYPGYLEKSPEPLEVTGVMSLPEGTRVVVMAEATKPLNAVDCVVNTAELTRTISTVPDADNPSTFRCDIGALAADTELLFTLTDTDLVANRQPIRLQINMIPDDSPVVESRFVGIGAAITPKAFLPLAGELTDDYSVVKSWFEFRADNEEPMTQYFDSPLNGQLEQDPPLVFDAIDRGLKPGQKFRIAVKAMDNYAAFADTEPHVESGKVEILDVVDESQLLAILEGHESVLRQRFEEIHERMIQSSDSLARVRLDAIFAPEAPKEQSTPAATDATKASGAEEDADASSETGDAETPPEEASSEEPAPQETSATRLRSIAQLTVEESLQNSERSGHEVRGIAESFEAILVELRNNRVSYFDEKEIRLQNQIADPMHEIVDLHYPRLDEKLKKLRTAIKNDDRVAAEVALASSRAEINAILVAMNEILGRMKELQSFNKVLAEFREIIANFDRITLLTKQRENEMKESLKKGLLED